MTPADMVKMYIALRDEKKRRDDAHKQSLAKMVEGMSKLEGLLLEHLQTTGAASLAVAGVGTVYKRIETSVTVEDPVAFDSFLRDNDDWSIADIKANKTAIKTLLEEGKALPPGVKATQVALVGVQRK